MSSFQVSHFRILSKLGSGGSAEVFLAEDLNLKRKIALKLLHAQLTTDAEKVERFRHEAQWASLLNHPNVITIFEIGESNGLHYIATEYVEGKTLRQHILHGMTILESLDVAIGICGALVAAHEAWIVHRDIKPENVMIRPDGLVKVLDFGVAKLTHATDAMGLKTQPKMLLGTVEYMAPEQVQGEGVDPRTDHFGLGLVLYEMISGTSPFRRESWMDSIGAILRDECPPLRHDSEEVPIELQQIVATALRKDPDERYQSASAMLADLRDLREEMQFRARAERRIERKQE